MSAIEHPRFVSGMSEAEKGVLFAILAHLVWGAMAVYFGFLRHISPVEIAVHRGLWSLPLAIIIVWWLGQFPEVRKAAANPKIIGIMALCGGLIVFNWGFYVWSIMMGRTLESSLGYYINPLLNVVAGYLFLGERFKPAQLVAIGLAVIAVLVQTIASGTVPWLGLMLASTFCLYGFLRKTVPVGATEGFLIEIAIISLPLLGAQIWLMNSGAAFFGGNMSDTMLLIGCGVLTTAALVCFAASIKRIRYSTAGLLQYISPSLVFLTAVFIFGEPMDVWKLTSFVIIWVALAVFSWSAIRDERARRVEAEAGL
jgi:chloramphenicol-sensitive protein RarD